MSANFSSKVSAHEACDEVVNTVKSSNLHFVLQETPHSVYITIRKKFINKEFVKESGDIDTRSALRCLEIDHYDLKKDFEEKIATHEEALNLVKTLKDKLDKVEENSFIESKKIKNETEELFVKGKNHPRKKHKKVNELKKRTKVENEEIIELKDSDVNQNFEVCVPVYNKFDIFDNLSATFPSILVSKSPSTTKLSQPASSEFKVVYSSRSPSHTPPRPSPRTPRVTTPKTPPGTPPSQAKSPSPGQRTNPTTDEIKEAFSELSVEMSAMADRLANRFDQACILPLSKKIHDES